MLGQNDAAYKDSFMLCIDKNLSTYNFKYVICYLKDDVARRQI
ncbi:hypothetical protein ACV56Z_09805 [Staphylococcus aureus]